MKDLGASHSAAASPPFAGLAAFLFVDNIAQTSVGRFDYAIVGAEYHAGSVSLRPRNPAVHRGAQGEQGDSHGEGD
jgi:hypothetical protein